MSKKINGLNLHKELYSHSYCNKNTDSNSNNKTFKHIKVLCIAKENNNLIYIVDSRNKKMLHNISSDLTFNTFFKKTKDIFNFQLILQLHYNILRELTFSKIKTNETLTLKDIIEFNPNSTSRFNFEIKVVSKIAYKDSSSNNIFINKFMYSLFSIKLNLNSDISKLLINELISNIEYMDFFVLHMIEIVNGFKLISKFLEQNTQRLQNNLQEENQEQANEQQQENLIVNLTQAVAEVKEMVDFINKNNYKIQQLLQLIFNDSISDEKISDDEIFKLKLALLGIHKKSLYFLEYDEYLNEFKIKENCSRSAANYKELIEFSEVMNNFFFDQLKKQKFKDSNYAQKKLVEYVCHPNNISMTILKTQENKNNKEILNKLIKNLANLNKQLTEGVAFSEIELKLLNSIKKIIKNNLPDYNTENSISKFKINQTISQKDTIVISDDELNDMLGLVNEINNDNSIDYMIIELKYALTCQINTKKRIKEAESIKDEHNLSKELQNNFKDEIHENKINEEKSNLNLSVSEEILENLLNNHENEIKIDECFFIKSTKYVE